MEYVETEYKDLAFRWDLHGQLRLRIVYFLSMEKFPHNYNTRHITQSDHEHLLWKIPTALPSCSLIIEDIRFAMTHGQCFSSWSWFTQSTLFRLSLTFENYSNLTIAVCVFLECFPNQIVRQNGRAVKRRQIQDETLVTRLHDQGWVQNFEKGEAAKFFFKLMPICGVLVVEFLCYSCFRWFFQF